MWPQQRSPLCRGIVTPGPKLFLWLIPNGRGSPKPHAPSTSWFSGTLLACEIEVSTRLSVTRQDLKSHGAFHILKDPIVRQTSSCWRHFQSYWSEGLKMSLWESVVIFAKARLSLAFPQIFCSYELFQRRADLAFPRWLSEWIIKCRKQMHKLCQTWGWDPYKGSQDN